ncbi:MAG: MotA/TolQ/ExbB proton channel family protein [Ruminococcus sp.]|nr:MotA/TolQ/ExbB proton channel family protein [Ruminococcus sp.]
MLKVIFMNIIGYDIIIFITAVFTGVVYHYLKLSADRLYKKLHLSIFVPDGSRSQKSADKDISELRETDVVGMRNHTGKLYSLFVNLTGIFPLLGILGTVISLLGMVADTTNVTGNFYGALTSTFWGLVFAIIYKFLDGMIYSKIEDNEKSVELFLQRNSPKAEGGSVSKASLEKPAAGQKRR